MATGSCTEALGGHCMITENETWIVLKTPEYLMKQSWSGGGGVCQREICTGMDPAHGEKCAAVEKSLKGKTV